jgi:hypothetical protein
MPPTLSKPSAAAPASIFYLTVGGLLTIWSGVWYAYLRNHDTGHQGLHYFCMGLLATGIMMLVLGFAIGPIARMSRHAELPPKDSNADAANNQNVTARHL